MERYTDAFYEPLVADLDNFGAWEDSGAMSSMQRATGIWQQALRDYKTPEICNNVASRISDYIEKHRAAGGAEILS